LKEEAKAFAGVRTFPLIALLGCSAALISDETGGWAFGIVLVILGLIIAIAYTVDALQGKVGVTSEMAALVVFVCGALAYWNYLAPAAALAVVTFGFLTLKPQLHRLAQRISSEDLYATLKFAVISLLVLPVLPNQIYGPPPLDAFNPYKTWLMVVFISGISFLGYVLIKVVGPRRGIGLTGLLGGLASSTAVTLSFSQRSEEQPGLARPFALAITLAWTVMFGRVIVEVAVLNQDLLGLLWLPLAAAMVAGLVFCVGYYFAQRTREESDVELSNPFELGPAIKFGILYAVVLIVAKVAQYYFQDAGVYVASAVAGLSDVDAITLSMAELAGTAGGVALPTAARAVVIAAIANTIVKGGIALTTGSGTLRRALWPPLVAMLITGAVAALLFV
jgi:uncharacterized membrane protein (DUF4010 family)